MEFKPLNVSVSRCVICGQMYDLMNYEDFAKQSEYLSKTAVIEFIGEDKVVLPFRGKYNGTSSLPGVYNAGIIDFVILPDEKNKSDYTPTKIVELSNQNSMKDILERKDTISRLDEPWITSPDNITQFAISDDDRAEMKCLKMALNKKQIDIDKYSSRFGDNFPNDKRQMKNNGATLNIIKRFCENMDMEALLTLRDKNPNVPNPMGTEITVSLTEDYFGEEEDNQ